MTYAIWCISTEGWVGEYDPVANPDGTWNWIPETYPSRAAAKRDLHDFTLDAKQREGFEIRPFTERTDVSNASYKVRGTRAPDFDKDNPEYILSYGRGKAKLTATVYRNEDPMTGTEWVVKGTKIKEPRKKDAVEAWGEWAAANYDAKGHEQASGKAKGKKKPQPPSAKDAAKPKKTGPPSLGQRRSKGGPPAFKRSSAPASSRNRPAHPDYEDDYNDVTDGDENPYLADFLSDKGLFDRDNPGKHWTLTPLGALDEVFNWMQENLEFTATLEYPWVRVTKVLQRAFPKDKKYQSTGAA